MKKSHTGIFELATLIPIHDATRLQAAGIKCTQFRLRHTMKNGYMTSRIITNEYENLCAERDVIVAEIKQKYPNLFIWKKK